MTNLGKRLGPACALMLAATSASATNVLVIIADDLGSDKVNGFANYGTDTPNYLPATPTIDELRASGLTFTAAWSNPVCSPTRASIQTGLHAYNHGVGWGIPEDGGADGELDNAAFTTLGERFQAGGFATAVFGKWHVGVTGSAGTTDWNLSATDPDPTVLAEDPHVILAGYDAYVGDPNGAVEYYDEWDRVDADGAGSSTITKESVHPDDVSVDEALAWIGAQTSPWMAVVAFNAPHTKHATPNDYELDDVDPSCHADPCMSSGTCPDLDGDGSTADDLQMLVYQSMVECMDDRIDTLLSGMAVPTLRDTIVVFLGDNGTPRGMSEHGYADSSTHDQGKNTVYESGVRVPLVLLDGQHWRDHVNGRSFSAGSIRSPGRVVTSAVHVHDLYDTLSEAVGLGVPAGTDAESLWRCATTTTATCATPRTGRFVYTEGYDHNASGTLSRGLAALRSTRYKMVVEYDRSGACLATELYDLTTDPYELTDLSAALPSTRNSFRNRITALAVPWMSGLPWC